MLRNLVTNSIKFAPKKSTITIALNKSGDNQIAVSISDEGVGIPLQELEEILWLVTEASARGVGSSSACEF